VLKNWYCTAASTTLIVGCRSILHADRTWGARHAGVLRPGPVAYFSAEFGIHESLPVYSGGLGVLAGDHIKSASDLDDSSDWRWSVLRSGIFPPTSGPQRLAAGRILAYRPDSVAAGGSDRQEWPPGRGEDRHPQWLDPCTGLASCSGTLRPILLDSDVEGNTPDDRGLTSRLYGGDSRAECGRSYC
jgi:glycogen phosphorylase